MEKRLLLFLVLSFGMMFIYTQFLAPPAPKPEESGGDGTGRPAVGTQAFSPGDPEPGEPETGTGPVAERAPVLPPLSTDGLLVTTARDSSSYDLTTQAVEWVFDGWGGSVRSVRLRKYTREPDQDLTDRTKWYRAIDDRGLDGLTRRDARSLTLLVLDAKGEKAYPLDKVIWDVEKGTDRVTFRYRWKEAGLEFVKTYIPADKVGSDREQDAYHLDVELSVKVIDRKKAVKFAPDGLRLRLVGPAAMPAEEFSQIKVEGVAQASDSASPDDFQLKDKQRFFPEKEDQKKGRHVDWAGMRSRFFASILLALDAKETLARQAVFTPIPDFDSDGKPFQNLSAALDFDVDLPEEGVSVSRRFLFFVGPMDPDILSVKTYESFKSVIDYGWFGPIVKILVFLLTIIRSVVGNWGVAIIILTLMVRASLFPLSRKSQVSMQKYQRQMARLKPKIDDIKKRHAKNKKKQQEEQMKLMKEEGMQMFPAGCLVMFLQLPVFIGLFQALRHTIGLRHSAFLWAKDLTAPDQLLGPWATDGIPLIWNPLYLNVFPILMGISWYLSSSMAPKPADPQQAQQMKMMKWMPVVFSIMLYNYAAGLALYMVVSSTWSIFEMKVVRKVFLKPDEAAAGGAAVAFRKGK